MLKPLVSVVIPCFNHGAYIHEAITSIEAYPDKSAYEIIIVNDGSTDSYTIQVMSELLAEGYHVINQSNQGLAATRNNGIRLAQGDYILPLDADNKIEPLYLSEAIKVFQSMPKTAVVYSDMGYFGDKSGARKVGEFDKYRMLTINQIDACALFRKSVWDECDGYDEKMPIMGWEDWDFWLSVLQKGYDFHYIPQPLYQYRVSGGSMISRTNRPDMQLVLRKYMLDKHILGRFESALSDKEKQKIYSNIIEHTTYNFLSIGVSYEIMTNAFQWFSTFQLDKHRKVFAFLRGLTHTVESKSKRLLLPVLKRYKLYK